MKTATLTLNGKTYEVQLTDEQVTEIEKPKKITGFERADEQHCYYFEDDWKIMKHCPEQNSINDDNRYVVANYYSDESLAAWCTRHDALDRQMRRWAAEHNDEPIDWTNEFPYKYHLYYDFSSETVEVDENRLYCHTTCCYFNTLQIAKEAIEEFGDEIKWLAENRPKWF